MKILTVCGNGIGSSLMLAMKIEEIWKAFLLMWSPVILTLHKESLPISSLQSRSLHSSSRAERLP